MSRPPTARPLLDRTAYHEAGHAVIAYRFRNYIDERGVTVDLSKPGGGQTYLQAEAYPFEGPAFRARGGVSWRNWTARAEREIMISIAGPLAELRYVHGKSPSGCLSPKSESADYSTARALFDCIFTDDPTNWLWGNYHDRVRRMLRERRTWQAIGKLAKLLRDTGFASEDAVSDICAGVPQISKREWIGQPVPALEAR
jgi:hypothetical protein